MRVQQGKWSRRSFLQTTAAGVAAAGVAGNFARIAEAADGLRSIGLGVSEINEIQDKATKDLGFSVSGQAMGYGDMFSKMLNQNDQYEIAEGYYNDMDVMLPAKVWQPIDTKKIKDWDKVTNLTKTGKLTPEIERWSGRPPYLFLWVDEHGAKVKGPSQYISMCPAFHNANSIGYNPKATGKAIESWGELLNKEYKGKVALLNVPQIGVMDAAMAIEALGLKKFGDKGNMTKPEIDFLIDYLIPLKKAGHFRAFWENFGQSVNLMVNGEVALESMWSPAVARDPGRGRARASTRSRRKACAVGTAVSLSPRRSRASSSTRPTSTSTGGSPAGRPRSSRARATIIRSLRTRRNSSRPRNGTTGTTASLRARTWPTRSAPSSSRKAMSAPAALYWNRYSKIAVWNSLMDENDYLVKRWTEFLTA